MADFQREPTDTSAASDARSLGSLFSDLTHNLTLLMRQEVALARSELGAKASQAARSVVSLLVGGLIVHMGVLTLIAGVVFVLVQLLDFPIWAAALLVGAVIVVVGLVPLLRGLNNLKQLELTPERTVASLKDDAQVIKETTR